MVFMRAGGIVAVCAVLLAIGGCPPAGESSQPSAFDDGLVSKRQDTIRHADETTQQGRPAPPDLTDCTRIEITYYPPTQKAIGLAYRSSIINTDERRYLESLRTVVVDDPNRIKILAQASGTGSYDKHGPLMQRFSDVACYRGEEQLTSFEDYGSTIRTQDGRWFKYKNDPVPIRELIPQIEPFRLRGRCATILYRLGVDLRTLSREEDALPAPHEWCDVLFQRRLTSPTIVITDEARATGYITKGFICPSGGEGKCHYAMNPNCEPNSPADMVLLFETKAGWNQHGGPELFTFDNHNPKGGCILLNDGSVKFIRTPEELHALCWK